MTEVDFTSLSASLPSQSDSFTCLIKFLKDSTLDERIIYVQRITHLLKKSHPFVPHYQYVQLVDLLNDSAHPSNGRELVDAATSLLKSLPDLCPDPNKIPSPLLGNDSENSDTESPSVPNRTNHTDSSLTDEMTLPFHCDTLIFCPPIPSLPPNYIRRLSSANSTRRASIADENRMSLTSTITSNVSDQLSRLSLEFADFGSYRGSEEDDTVTCCDAFTSPMLTRSEYQTQQQKLFTGYLAPPPTPNFGTESIFARSPSVRPHSTSELERPRRRRGVRNASPTPQLYPSDVRLPYSVTLPSGYSPQHTNPNDDDSQS
ncbi:hypothetical protein BLNAU_12227 [Blattamonas nauphoetae]|uniref:Uncharacterized protein n=1 Tax=Blattamonas nauphoetae TaxID=2049346 RepID=A0ABQ9XLY4_9EUKA|nr:hypothetical protein BLNAU_12227 [Blattamonas nauphoetae]